MSSGGGVGKGLDSVGDWWARSGVDCTVDYTVSSYTEDFDEFEGASINESAERWVNGGRLGRHHRRS